MIDQMTYLLKQQDMGVLATSLNDRPHTSLMAYVTDDEGRTVYLVTLKTGAKYKNMMNNPNVSLLVDTRRTGEAGLSEVQALTVAGQSSPVADPVQRDAVRARLIGRHPHIRILAEDPEAEIMAVRIQSFLLLIGASQAHFEPVGEQDAGA